MLRDALRLQAWDFEVVEGDADDGAVLDVKPDPRIWWARVRVGSFFTTDPNIVHGPLEQRQAATHELLHLPQADLLRWVHEGDWVKPLAPDVADAIRSRVVDEIEKVTDFYARALAPSLPMPPEWPDAS